MDIIITQAFILVFIGIYTMITKKNLLKILLGLIITVESAHLVLLYAGMQTNSTVPQSMALTSMVISGCVIGVVSALIYRIFSKHKTLNTKDLRRLKW